MRACVLLSLLLGLAASIVRAESPSAKAVELPAAAGRTVDFVRDIQPILAEQCNHCHGEDEQQGYLRLDAKAIVLHGGKSGPLLVSRQERREPARFTASSASGPRSGCRWTTSR